MKASGERPGMYTEAEGREEEQEKDDQKGVEGYGKSDERCEAGHVDLLLSMSNV